jgi:hypothetical protein
MRRREFITLLGGAAASWPLSAWAQQPSLPTIGFLSGGLRGAYSQIEAAFLDGLKEAQNVTRIGYARFAPTVVIRSYPSGNSPS